ncbi:MAG: tRNA lysidine(34) synthetase TilS [Microscillaceae bacterium]|nr:tRNA lysidine(34) synthetase TilS [Microscillaceae bacterium]
MLLSQFEEFVKKKNLFRPDEKILLALSGGIDSMVMATLFHQANFSFAAAHINFQLRGSESEADAAFVQKWAEKFLIKLFKITFDTKKAAAQSGTSIQMTARRLRYAWLAEIAREHHFDKIATAHHANDALETALLNFVKGTGVAGLKGIAAKKGNLVRPLLFATKDQIRAFAQAENLAWREDASNQKADYQRNFIRLEIIPRLELINPALVQTYTHTAERLEATEALVHQHQQKLENQALRQEEGLMFISIPLFAQSEAPLLF